MSQGYTPNMQEINIRKYLLSLNLRAKKKMRSKSLERCLEVAKTGFNLWFHPTGIRSMAQKISKRLKLNSVNSQIVSGVGFSGDILKYSPYLLIPTMATYYYLMR